jgi:hypothetical protein
MASTNEAIVATAAKMIEGSTLWLNLEYRKQKDPRASEITPPIPSTQNSHESFAD